VYCSKTANGKYSVCGAFTDGQGNIRFDLVKHAWKHGRCTFCGVSQKEFDRGGELETHAYEFIHTNQPEEIFNMKFDVIVGNPPYQLGSDGGTRDIPIYNKFVDQAKKLNPRFLSMIIPSRWMATGLGLSEFRRTMLEDRRIRKLVDYGRMDEVFPGVDFEGGVCFFLWDRDTEGDCAVTTISGDEVMGPVPRDLREYDVFVRDSRALKILRKILSAKEASITDILSADKEFGWTSNFDGFHEKQKPNDVALHYNRKGKRLVGWINRKEIGKSPHLIDTWKVMVPAAYGERGTRPATVLGPSFIAGSPSVCTQTYLFFYVGSKNEADSLNSYLRTRLFRFLVSLRKITQHATRSTYTWVPQQVWNRTWTDEALYKQY
jgi:site-specific DNA-methyltransferase (adenine-specific)